jgi:hypothetical protein
MTGLGMAVVAETVQEVENKFPETTSSGSHQTVAMTTVHGDMALLATTSTGVEGMVRKRKNQKKKGVKNVVDKFSGSADDLPPVTWHPMAESDLLGTRHHVDRTDDVSGALSEGETRKRRKRRMNALTSVTSHELGDSDLLGQSNSAMSRMPTSGLAEEPRLSELPPIPVRYKAKKMLKTERKQTMSDDDELHQVCALSDLIDDYDEEGSTVKKARHQSSLELSKRSADSGSVTAHKARTGWTGMDTDQSPGGMLPRIPTSIISTNARTESSETVQRSHHVIAIGDLVSDDSDDNSDREIVKTSSLHAKSERSISWPRKVSKTKTVKNKTVELITDRGRQTGGGISGELESDSDGGVGPSSTRHSRGSRHSKDSSRRSQSMSRDQVRLLDATDIDEMTS